MSLEQIQNLLDAGNEAMAELWDQYPDGECTVDPRISEIQDQIMTLKMDLQKTKRAKNSYREVLDIVANVFYASGDSRALEPIQEEIDDLERILEGLEEQISWMDTCIVDLEKIKKIWQN